MRAKFLIVAEPLCAVGARRQRSPEEAPGLCGVDVLVVDDEPEAREVAAAVLRHHGATVSVAADAEEAVRQYEATPPNVLLLDIAMPGTDGYELLQRVRARGGDDREAVPAIALTALAREEDRRRAFASAFQLHLAKPIDSLSLVRAISAVCRA